MVGILAAAIQALVLYGASPSDARAAAQAAFSARQGKTRVRGNPDSRFFILLSNTVLLRPGVLPQKRCTRAGASSPGRGHSRW